MQSDCQFIIMIIVFQETYNIPVPSLPSWSSFAAGYSQGRLQLFGFHRQDYAMLCVGVLDSKPKNSYSYLSTLH